MRLLVAASFRIAVDQPHYRLAVFVEVRLQALIVDFAGFDFVQDAVDRKLEAIILLDAGNDVGLRASTGSMRFIFQQSPNLIEQQPHRSDPRWRGSACFPRARSATGKT